MWRFFLSPCGFISPFPRGEVVFRCPVVKQLTPIEFIDPGKIKRVRGVCYTTRLNPSFAARVVDAVKGLSSLPWKTVNCWSLTVAM